MVLVTLNVKLGCILTVFYTAAASQMSKVISNNSLLVFMRARSTEDMRMATQGAGAEALEL